MNTKSGSCLDSLDKRVVLAFGHNLAGRETLRGNLAGRNTRSRQAAYMDPRSCTRMNINWYYYCAATGTSFYECTSNSYCKIVAPFKVLFVRVSYPSCD